MAALSSQTNQDHLVETLSSPSIQPLLASTQSRTTMTSRSDADDPEQPDTYSIAPSTPQKLAGLNYVNIFAYLINIAVTYGIGVGGFTDLPTNSELSAKYQTLVTPIGWA